MLMKITIATVLSLGLVSAAMAAGSTSTSTQTSASNYERGVEAIEATKFKKARKLFKKAVKDNPENADAWNYLGFSNRKLEKFDQALDAYQKALAINPDHLGANEYLGELFLQTGELEKARERLKKLNNICTAGCEELDDLKAAVLAYENS